MDVVKLPCVSLPEVRLTGASSGATPPCPYISNGLVMWLDGIEKGDVADAWTDLIGKRIFRNHGATAIDNGWSFGNTPGKIATQYLEHSAPLTFPYDTHTVEGCFIVGGSLPYTTSFIVFCTATSDSLVIGNVGRQQPLLSCKHCSTESGLNNPLSFDWNPSTKTILASCAKDVAIVNGNTLNRNADQCWNYSNVHTAWVGGREGSASSFNGIIHSIRVYNRLLSTEEMLQNQQADMKRFNLSV